MIVDKTERSCDHCGTIERALKLWPKEIHESCPCACHLPYVQHRLPKDGKTKRRAKGYR